jgi:hypothetical protein
LDVTWQLAAVVLAALQLSALWGRRNTLDWIGPPDYFMFVKVLGSCLLPIAVAWLYARDRHDGVKGGLEVVLALAIGLPVGAMTLLALLGVNLLAPRYLMVIAVPASVLAGLALSRLRTPVAWVSVAFALATTAAASAIAWRTSGVPATLIHEDWRGAVQTLSRELSAVPGAFVLYRPGFVEQEPGLPQSPVLMAPLRSPGSPEREWPVVPLTFSWWSAAREPYFRQVLQPAVANAKTFFVLIGGTTPKTGHYGPLLVDWIETAFPGGFAGRSLGNFHGVALLRFDRGPATSRAPQALPQSLTADPAGYSDFDATPWRADRNASALPATTSRIQGTSRHDPGSPARSPQFHALSARQSPMGLRR